MKAFIFKYSAKTGLTKLIDASRVSEAEYSALEQNTKWLQLQKEPSLTLWLFFFPPFLMLVMNGAWITAYKREIANCNLRVESGTIWKWYQN